MKKQEIIFFFYLEGPVIIKVSAAEQASASEQ
jgi:hypothetical protein